MSVRLLPNAKIMAALIVLATTSLSSAAQASFIASTPSTRQKLNQTPFASGRQPSYLLDISSRGHSTATISQRQKQQSHALHAGMNQDAVTNTAIFIAGIIPFAWATFEFWNRIAVGEPFGTGKDSVYIGKDNAPDQSRGRRVLDKGAFVVAYILFAIAAGVIGVSLFSVMSSDLPQMKSS